MQDKARALIRSMFDASNQNNIQFGQVVSQLIGVGVESYHVDYRAGRNTYHLPGGGIVDQAFAPPETIADGFDVEAVRSAIARVQQGKVTYPEFKLLTQQAGCVGYSVWLAGRHVAYYGRKGETHIEHFPN